VKFVIAQMPNDAATEKAGSAEHDDGATVRCRHGSNLPILSEHLTAEIFIRTVGATGSKLLLRRPLIFSPDIAG
jgi:hypothetical protein